jgi:PAS domain S-box-containing protein
LAFEKSDTGEKSESSDASKSKSELLDVISLLRKNISAMEADIRATRERDQTLSSAINIGHWEWDELTKNAAYFSEEMAGIFGMSREKLYEIYKDEEDIYSLIHPDDLEHYIANLHAVLDPNHPRGRAHTFDYRIVRPDGEVRYVRELEYGTREEDGVIVQSYGAIQDITDRHESIRALRESEQRYSSLFSKLPLGVIEQDWSSIKKVVDKLQSEGVKDLKAYFHKNPHVVRELVSTIVISSVNDALLKIYGAKSAADYIDSEEDSSTWLDEEWAILYAAEIVALASPGRIHYAELTETRMDDSEFETRLITSVVKGDEDSWKRILTIVEDVSERKQNELALIEAKEAAELASKAKS